MRLQAGGQVVGVAGRQAGRKRCEPSGRAPDRHLDSAPLGSLQHQKQPQQQNQLQRQEQQQQECRALPSQVTLPELQHCHIL
jgi:hypothetical protein